MKICLFFPIRVWNFLRRNMVTANMTYVNDEMSKNNIQYCYLNLRSRANDIVEFKQYSNNGRPTFHLMEEILCKFVSYC